MISRGLRWLLLSYKNSSIEYERELAEYVQILERTIKKLQTEAYTANGQALCARGEEAKTRIELAALKEKYRWRVQGKENAPDWECILYITKNKEVRMDVGRGLEDGERWMPLPDIPKEEAKP